MTPCRIGYTPVSTEARDGAQIAMVVNACVNLMPAAPRASIVGVDTCGLPYAPKSHWS